MNILKAFISVDLEGMPYIVTPAQLGIKGSLYKEARDIATKVTSIVCDELHKCGFNEVIIADSHGPMVNLLVESLPDYVEIVRGFPRPLSMVAGSEGCNAALLLGYHAKYGTPLSTFDHTYSGGTIREVKVNGIPASEFLLNTYVLGEIGVPLILVAGEAKLIEEDVKVFTPWSETVILKNSLSRVSAKSPSMSKIELELRSTVKRAVNKFNNGETKPLKPKHPVKFELTFLASHFADVAALAPNVKRVDGLTVEYVCEDMMSAYKFFELLILAGSAVANILQRDAG
ncbi:MAG: M55 family metallopeptidase [Candidatus Methanomethylicia archaeon]